MGSRGPSKKPRQILENKGSRVRKDRYPDKGSVMTPSPGGAEKKIDSLIKPPSHLTLGAKKEWNKVAPFLLENDMSHEIFNGMLEAYCYNLDLCRQMQKHLKKKSVGYTYSVTNKYGDEQWYIRPEVKVYNDALSHVKSISRDFGLTPSSVGQIKVSKPGGPSGWAAITG
ncbi:MAG: phage terminase small subunit P27 family [Roseivirga sp.]|nr:phage terminase small subunit P27 family [Roseivirga sp.]